MLARVTVEVIYAIIEVMILVLTMDMWRKEIYLSCAQVFVSYCSLQDAHRFDQRGSRVLAHFDIFHAT